MTKINVLYCVCICFVLSFNSACRNEKVSTMYLNTTDKKLTENQRIVYYNTAAFTGVIFSVNAQADTTSKTPYRNGKKDGLAIKYYNSGSVAEKCFYVNGNKENCRMAWYENGNKKFEYNYIHDIFNGSYYEWYENGSPYKSLHFKNGHEDGIQQTWNSDGSIYANYEMKNGRKYGLTGTKHCINNGYTVSQ